nr:uncharacterized protein LOC107279207 isoform X3 [Oryza sativa Japonica Group]
MSSSAMEAMDKLVQLAESMCQAASLLLGDNDPSDESSPRRPSTFLNAVALGNVGASKSAVPRRPHAHPPRRRHRLLAHSGGRVRRPRRLMLPPRWTPSTKPSASSNPSSTTAKATSTRQRCGRRS